MRFDLGGFEGGFAEWLGDDAFDWDFYGRWLEPKCEPTARASSPKAVELDWDPDNEAESLALVRRISAEDAAARDAASVAVMRSTPSATWSRWSGASRPTRAWGPRA